MRIRSLLLLFLWFLSLVAACAGEGGPATPPLPAASPADGRTTVRFAVFDWDRTAYSERLAAFEEVHPDLHVEIVSADALLGGNPAGWPDDLESVLFKAADVVALGPSRDAVRRGLVRDLAPLSAGDAALDSADFYPALLEAYRWDGGTWALPTAATFQLIYYDRAALAAAGVAWPRPGWTWGQFLDAARALTVREGGEVTRWGFVERMPNPRPFVEGRAGPLVDYGANPPVPRFDAPEVAAAVAWYAGLYLAEQVAPVATVQEAGAAAVSPAELLVEGGQAAMWTALAGSAAPGAVDEAGAAPYPVDEGAPLGTTPFWPPGLAMSAGTTVPRAAWQWMVFLTRQPPVDSGTGIVALPARRSVAQSSGFWDDLDPGLVRALRYAADHALAWHPDDAGDEALDRALDAILGAGTPLDEALVEAQSRALADLQAAATRPAPAATFAVALPVPEDEGAAEVITFLGTGGAPAVEAYRDLAALFAGDHPGIVVDVVTPTFEQNLSDLAAAADCFEWPVVSPGLEEEAAILSLDPFLEADPAFPIDDFYPQLLDAFRREGQLWGLPSGTVPYVIEYNKDLFDAAGVAYPAAGWTVDDFLATAVALTHGENETKQYGFVGQVYEYLDLLLMLDRLGARLVDRGVDPPAFGFDDPSTVDALAWYAALATEHGARPVFGSGLSAAMDHALLAERDALVTEGHAAMWTSYGPNTDFVEREALDVGIVPLPAASDGASGSGYQRASGYYISSSTPHRQACWQWITFLTGQVGTADGLPGRRSVAESGAYRRLAGDERADVYVASLGSESESIWQAFAAEPWMSPAFAWLYRAYDQVLQGDAGADLALHDAQRLANDYRACVAARSAFVDRAAWEACLHDVDPTLPEDAAGSGGGAMPTGRHGG
ncbi:MAG: extracellular solute-binding protein [Anaerolineae bacterium]|nr:extracellular solute-binding protein [Anaerolineae bacterium]